MIDTHIHLSHKAFSNIDEVIQKAKINNVTKVILIGCNIKECESNYEIKEKYPEFVDLVVGLHPVGVSKFLKTDIDLIEQFINTHNACAIGEIGLDYHWHPEEKEIQKNLFIKQIELAKKYDLPVIIHAREAYEDTYEILKSYAPITGIMHSFAGTPEMAHKFIELGLEIGLSGPITFKNGQSQRDVAKLISLDKIHLETDGPYLTPEPYRGKTNYPEYIKYVAQEIAFQKNISLDEVIQQTTNNANRLFRLKGTNV